MTQSSLTCHKKMKQSEKQEQRRCKNGLVSDVRVNYTFLKRITDYVRGEVDSKSQMYLWSALFHLRSACFHFNCY